MKKPKIEPLVLDTLLTVLKNSVGVKMFRRLYARVNGVKKDVLEDGDLSCAFFVSSALAMFGLIDRAYGTVAGTIKALPKFGWRKSKTLKPGSILVWAEKLGDDGHKHSHLGFYLGNKKAISNSSRCRSPQIHHFTFGVKAGQPVRKIVAIYNHPKIR